MVWAGIEMGYHQYKDGRGWYYRGRRHGAWYVQPVGKNPPKTVGESASGCLTAIVWIVGIGLVVNAVEGAYRLIQGLFR
jgi:hypothetical protein